MQPPSVSPSLPSLPSPRASFHKLLAALDAVPLENAVVGVVVRDSEEAVSVDVRNHAISIDARAVEPMLRFAKRALRESRHNEEPEQQQEEATQLEFTAEQVSRVLLLLVGDYGAAWNARRRRLAELSHEDALALEWAYTAVVIRRFPKSSEAWWHLWYITVRLFASSRHPIPKVAPDKNIVARARALCERICEQSPSNYYAWTFRTRLLVLELEACDGMDSVRECVRRELEYADRWLWMHVSQSCVYHFRRALIELQIKHCWSAAESVNQGVRLVRAEMALAERVQQRYPRAAPQCIETHTVALQRRLSLLLDDDTTVEPVPALN
ncbi:Protein prenyltransferase alpha subunit repeat-containing protein 1 [Porphyridium purpureum]|uniref:Protein prenyltransferase alpha subunit repeat-containing protein 1 n=1 Tax=Porphyridium purpureum TaxID=35688 RepID=A0A5J4YKF6_PORPP|nr:Protein prenyltransferase alpha subunit repeat-containing protein 1 [Porphyridium purpureum]|eukprot:POR1856..scf210_14